MWEIFPLRYISLSRKRELQSEWSTLQWIASTLIKRFDALKAFNRYGIGAFATQSLLTFETKPSYKAFVDRYAFKAEQKTRRRFDR